MKLSILLCISIFSVLFMSSFDFSAAQGTVICGEVDGERVVFASDNPVSFCDDVTITENGVLRAMAGVEILLPQGGDVTILGSLILDGDQMSPVRVSGSPRSLSFDNSSGGAVVLFRHVLIDGVYSGLYFDNKLVSIENTIVTNSGTISFDQADVRIASSSFHGRDREVVSFYGGRAALSNIFIDAAKSDVGLSVYDGAVLVVSSTTIVSSLYSGLSVYDSVVSGMSNRFLNNAVTGIEVYGSSTVTLERASLSNQILNVISFGLSTTTVSDSWWGGGEPMSGVEYLGEVNPSPWLAFDPNSIRPKVFFLPGIQASRLYVADGNGENQLWEPNRPKDVERLLLDDSGVSVEGGVYTRDVVDQVNVFVKTDKVYKSFIDFLTQSKGSGLISDYEIMAYDWRYSLTAVASIFAEGFSWAGPSVFIGHSNGGLLAKIILSLLPERYKEHASLVLVASPQLGSVQALASLLHADSLPILKGLIMSGELAQRFIAPMVSAYTLLPFDPLIGSSSPLSFDAKTKDFLVDKNPKWIDYLKSFPFKKSPGVTLDFLSPKINVDALNKGLDIQRTLAEIDKELVPDLTIFGYGVRTLGGIQYSAKEVCSKKTILSRLKLCTPHSKISYSPIYKDGDGTVEVVSAWPSYPAASSSFAVNLKGSQHDHVDILEDDRVIGRIEDFLASGSQGLVAAAVTHSSFKEDLVIRSDDPSLDLSLVLEDGSRVGIRTSDQGLNFINKTPGTSYKKFGGTTEVIIEDYKNSFSENLAPKFTVELIGVGVGNASVTVGENVLPDLPVINDSYGRVSFDGDEPVGITYYPIGTSSQSYEIESRTDSSLLGEIEDEVYKHVKNNYCVQRTTGEVVRR